MPVRLSIAMDLRVCSSEFKTNLITLIYSPLSQRKSLIMKNISTGFGLCAIAAAVALYPVLDRFAPIGKEAHAGVPVSAITSAALAQTAPTIVWYGWNSPLSLIGGTSILSRAWSDGRVEIKRVFYGDSGDCSWDTDPPCSLPWWTIVSPTQGLAAASDSNFDAKVDGADLAMLLGNWGENMACEPEPTYPCLDLSLAGGGALR